MVHHHIYFPTYTNGLKDLGHFLGYERTTEIPNGLQSIIWRKSWEADAQPRTKETLLRYNKEDCVALAALRVHRELLEIPNSDPVSKRSQNIARTDAIAPEEIFRASFGRKKFALDGSGVCQ